MRFPIQDSPLWGIHVLISKLGRTGLVLVRLRAYSKHLTAASWKLWYRLASTAGTLLKDVSIYMACSWILNALSPLVSSQNLFPWMHVVAAQPSGQRRRGLT